MPYDANSTMCSTEDDCPGNQYCKDFVCACSYLYALGDLSTCEGLTAESSWSVASRAMSALVYGICGSWITWLLTQSRPSQGGSFCSPSRASLLLALLAMVCLFGEMVYTVVFLAKIGLNQSVNWSIQRSVRNTLEGLAYACGCLCGLMISLSWIDAMLATRQLERLSVMRVVRTRAAIAALMACACAGRNSCALLPQILPWFGLATDEVTGCTFGRLCRFRNAHRCAQRAPRYLSSKGVQHL